MNWMERISLIEQLDDALLDPIAVQRLQWLHDSTINTVSGADSYSVYNDITFYIPSFKSYHLDIGVVGQAAACQQQACGKNAWPAVSITGAACQLQCDHCKAKILEPMIAATTPKQLWRVVSEQIDKGAQGMLLTGGSNVRNEVEYNDFLPVIRKIKRRNPAFTIVCHTALVDASVALAMEEAGIDVAMMDVIGAQDTITQVYHLKRRVDDFDNTLQALTNTSMRVVPHIVLGLHYGRLLGEWQALDIVQRYPVDALVLVVVMPYYAPVKRPFDVPDSRVVGRFFAQAKQQLGNTPLFLGCARPAGRVKTEIDIYALLAGFSGIAYPSEGIAELASALGRDVNVSSSCCSMGTEDLSLAFAARNAVAS